MKQLLVTLFVVVCAASLVAAEVKLPEHPADGVTYEAVHESDPPQSAYAVKIDLTNPHVRLRVAPGGPDPDGAGEWQTTLQPASEAAQREGFDVTINASYFTARNTQDAEGEKSGFVKGKWSQAVGWAMTDGKLWSADRKKDWPAMWIEGDRTVRIGSPNELPRSARQAVQGNGYVLKDGKPAEPVGNLKVRHPRTVVGIDKAGHTLVLLTVDGRNPSKAIGMTGPDLAEEILRLGCWTAINLDGGGSTTLVMRDPSDGKLKIVNDPSDHRERAVADVIGVTVLPSGSPATQPTK